MKYFYLCFFFFCSFFIYAIEYQPWFGNIYEFNFLSRYAYSYFSSVDSALPPLKSTSNDHLLYFGLEIPPSTKVSLDSDIEFTNTPRQSLSFRSVAFQGRYLFYDDIIGDAVSLALGGNIRYTSSRSLKDISCPYYSNCDFEGTLAIGKEVDCIENWRFRFWGVGGLGMGNRGSPWMFALLALEGNNKESNKWSLFFAGSHGYGRKTVVEINHFYGYGKIREKNIDIGGRFGHKFGVWGTISLEYRRRLFAKRCPKDVNTFAISYLLPFSF